MFPERSRMHLQQPVDEIHQRRLPRHGRCAHSCPAPVLRHLSRTRCYHLLFLGTFLRMIRKISCEKAFRRRRCHKFRAHSVTGVRSYGCIETVFDRLPSEFQRPIYNLPAIMRPGPEHLDECPGIHRGLRLHGKAVIAVAYVRHSRDPGLPHPVHLQRQRLYLVLPGGTVPEGVYLVDEPCHTASLEELSPEMRQLHVAVGIHESGHYDAIPEIRFGQKIITFPCPYHRTIILGLDKTIHYRIETVESIDIFSCYPSHFYFFMTDLTFTGRIPLSSAASRPSCILTGRNPSSTALCFIWPDSSTGV